MDEDIPWCANLAAAFGDEFSTYLGIVLYRMSMTQRRKIYARWDFSADCSRDLATRSILSARALAERLSLQNGLLTSGSIPH
jgi:hypothetical protein